MKRGALWIVLVVFSALGIAGCGCNSGPRVIITTAPTTLAPGASGDVAATITHDSKVLGVMWSCMPVGSCGSFNPTQTASTIDSVYTAPAAAPAGTMVTIIATSVADNNISSSTTITITGVTTENFVFYVSGENDNEGSSYAIAGVVTIAQDGSGDVLGGEQDYNDGDGNTSPSTGDLITGGSLVMAGDGSGNAILTLTTNNASLPNEGTEIFALAYPNPNHAAIVEFDGSATSLGSLDLQTSTAMPVSASFSFVSSGADPNFEAIAYGGVFTADASGNLNGMFDVNDNGTTTLGTTFPDGAALGVTDPLGRGVVTGITGSATSINYYVVGTEVLRIIDVDTGDTAVGSAYGQGDSAGSFSSGSIGQSVFSIGNSYDFYGAVGEFTTTPETGAQPKANTPVRALETKCTGTSTCLFTGVADLHDLGHGIQLAAQSINGTYMIAANGYGNMDFGESFETVTQLGVYAVDPTLNILDPNNTSDTVDAGGALIAEMDANLVGIGSIVPQTSVTSASFNGTYAFSAQGDTTEGDEFDFVGTATVTFGETSTSFVGEGSLSDPFNALGVSTAGVESSNATFNATATTDPDNPGHYIFSQITVAASNTPPDFTSFNFYTIGAYQASGGQLFWIDLDLDPTYFIGALEQFPTSSTDVRKAMLKKHKP
jgi:hypothetical protein